MKSARKVASVTSRRLAPADWISMLLTELPLIVVPRSHCSTRHLLAPVSHPR